ncbi:DOMINA protein [Strongyloides ratti]|uniref:DOMINA protein n=1 Tax=Strongyloides ratti TaxID=34506 RepID=A0A090L812_STRRB|nr:DOMINA protein [Strongyloides ratti]CEF65941.1 DOMINA protein [Strongyloides ratti]
MTSYICKNQFRISNSSTSSLFSAATSPSIYGSDFSPNMEQQQQQRNRDYLSTPDSAISLNDNLSISPKVEYDMFSQSNEALPSNNSSSNNFYHQQQSPYDYPDYHSSGSVTSHMNISATKEYLNNVIGSNLHDPYCLPHPPQSSNPLVQLESFTKEALSNVIPFPKTNISLQNDYSTTGKSASGFIKPPCSYPCLIAIALNNAVTNRLNVSELYEFIQYYFPFFQRAPEGWKNSVRHNLSTNGWFNKVDEGRSGYAGRRSFLWGFTNPGVKDKAMSDVKKQVVKKYKDMCDSIICSGLLEPLLNGERSFYPNSCHQSPFIGCNGTGINGYIKRDSDYSCDRDRGYHSQPNFSTGSPLVGNQKVSRKRSHRMIQSNSCVESNSPYGNDSTSYQPEVKKEYDGNRSYSSNTSNDSNRLLSQSIPNYMIQYNFPFNGDGSQGQFNLYRQQFPPIYSVASGVDYSYNLPKYQPIPAQNGVDYYSTTSTTRSENYPPVVDNCCKKEAKDLVNNTSITSGSSSSTISTSGQGTAHHDISTGSWNQNQSSPSPSTPHHQSTESLEKTPTKSEPYIDEVLNEFFIPTHSISL